MKSLWIVLSSLMSAAMMRAETENLAPSDLAEPSPAPLIACGGDFDEFKARFADYARAQGIDGDAISTTVAAASWREDILKLDRRQSSFKQSFLEFSSRTVSASRLEIGAQKLAEFDEVFARMREEYGVAPEVIATFWAMETDFGAVQGDMPTIAALATLSHDCRRPALFQPQLLGAIKLTAKGEINPATLTGAWAGEIGQVQMLPADILRLGVDGDGDGKVDLKSSPEDAILSAANLLKAHGWRAGEPWLAEVYVEGDEAWAMSGLDQQLSLSEWTELGVSLGHEAAYDGEMRASLIAPQGRFGPKFLAFANYDVFLEWNKSFIYSLSAAYMATRFAGAAPYEAGTPEAGLDPDQTKTLQTMLEARGYDVGGIDGIIGAKTRAAVRSVQNELGWITDGWPTPALIEAIAE